MDAQGHETVPDEGRRRLFKTTAAGAGAALAGAALPAAPALAKDSDDASLATRSFVEVLPVPLVKQPVAALSPAPLVTRGEGECGRGSHQRWGEFEPRKLYELHVKEALHSFHRDLPTQRVWGYDGMLPGPTVVARYNEPVLVRIFNELPANHIGFGSPEITTHLHNLHMASESDGFTGDYYSSTRFGPTLTGPGGYRDHHYPNCYAGYDAFSSTQGDAREALGTCWYHDHRLDFTGPNVYRGLSGFYLLFDELDSGNEEDANPNALRLPSGVGRYDIPLVFQDRRFDRKGMLAFDSFNSDGLLGDKFLVNGKIQPLFEVERRKYRFRLLNGGPARFYEFHLMYQNAEQDFTYIANDGNLLPAPLTMRKIRMGVAERADIVIDFSKYPIGSQLFLVNRLEQDDGRGPDDKLMKSGTQLLRFDVRSIRRAPISAACRPGCAICPTCPAKRSCASCPPVCGSLTAPTAAGPSTATTSMSKSRPPGSSAGPRKCGYCGAPATGITRCISISRRDASCRATARRLRCTSAGARMSTCSSPARRSASSCAFATMKASTSCIATTACTRTTR